MRKFVSSILFFTLVLILITGIILYIMPHGRIAYWTGWKLFGLNKDQWEAVHITFGFLMSFLALYHLFLNWKSFKKYVVSRSFAIAGIFSLVLIIIAIKNLPPVNYIMSLEESIKSSWEKNLEKPPVPHAELFTLRKISRRFNIPLKELILRAKKLGAQDISPDTSLKELAKKLHTTPAKVFHLIIEEKINQFKKKK